MHVHISPKVIRLFWNDSTVHMKGHFQMHTYVKANWKKFLALLKPKYLLAQAIPWWWPLRRMERDIFQKRVESGRGLIEEVKEGEHVSKSFVWFFSRECFLGKLDRIFLLELLRCSGEGSYCHADGRSLITVTHIAEERTDPLKLSLDLYMDTLTNTQQNKYKLINYL